MRFAGVIGSSNEAVDASTESGGFPAIRRRRDPSPAARGAASRPQPSRAQHAIAGLVCLLALLAHPARGLAQPAREVHELRYDPLVDVSVTAAFAAYAVAAELAKPALVPDACRWCDSGPSGEDRLNGLDASSRSALRWRDGEAAGALSDVSAFVMLPVLSLGGTAALAASNRRRDAIAIDLGIVLEAVSVSMALVETVKIGSARERPYAHFASQPPARADSRMSFHSGHASLAFTLAVAGGTVAELRGYRYRHLLWATGLPLAAATGYLRIAADKHYATDVLVGAIAGSAVGAAIPLVFHGRKRELRVTPTYAPGSAGIAVSGRF